MTRRYTERRSVGDLIAENRRGFLIVAALVVVLLLAMLGMFTPSDEQPGDAGGEEPQSSRCDRASAAVVSAIESGLTVTGGGSLSNAFIVRSDDFESVYFVAAQIEGEGLSDTVGVWARNDPQGGGAIFSAEALAVEFSDWGEGPGFSSSDDGLSEARDCAGG